MKYIKLTYENGMSTHIDISKSRELVYSNSLTYIYFGDNDYIKVKETPEEIFKLIESL